ncbi:hypothetical protein CHU98_g9394 [Xylaria longipes]|nr:hypothetical protein CHU98_g9394 [Xylaria longipes]
MRVRTQLPPFPRNALDIAINVALIAFGKHPDEHVEKRETMRTFWDSDGGTLSDLVRDKYLGIGEPFIGRLERCISNVSTMPPPMGWSTRKVTAQLTGTFRNFSPFTFRHVPDQCRQSRLPRAAPTCALNAAHLNGVEDPKYQVTYGTITPVPEGGRWEVGLPSPVCYNLADTQKVQRSLPKVRTHRLRPTFQFCQAELSPAIKVVQSPWSSTRRCTLTASPLVFRRSLSHRVSPLVRLPGFASPNVDQGSSESRANRARRSKASQYHRRAASDSRTAPTALSACVDVRGGPSSGYYSSRLHGNEEILGPAYNGSSLTERSRGPHGVLPGSVYHQGSEHYFTSRSLVRHRRTVACLGQGQLPASTTMREQEQSPAGDRPTSQSPEHIEQDGAVDGSQALQLINVKEDGRVSYADLYSLEQYLDASPDKAEALEAIIMDISDFIEKEEAFKEWTSEVYDLIARKNYWEGGRHGSLKSWQAHHRQFSDTAKQGRAIRNKRKSAIDSLVANGVSGPRFEYMIRHSSRTFIDAVPNVRAFHRLKAGSKGSKGAHTQTCDLAELDSVTYRILSPSELASIKAKVGTHGFLQEACAEEEAVLDVDFDLATQSFVVGSGGFAQPEEYGKAHPKIMPAESDEEDERPTKKVKAKKGQETFDVHRFTYITECTCPGEVPHALRSGLDKLAANCAYSALSAIVPDILQSCDKLCPRH